MKGAGRLLAVALLVSGACDAGSRPPSAARDQSGPEHAAGVTTTASPPNVGDAGTVEAAPPVQPRDAPGSRARPDVEVGTTTTQAQGGTLKTTTTTTTTVTAKSQCPNPKTCPTYAISPGQRGWRPGPDGVARIPFYLDTTVPTGSDVTPAQMREAYFAAMRVWESSNPRIKFDYRGDTSRAQVTGDGVSQFAWGLSVTTRTDGDGYLIEADINRSTAMGSDAWSPCEQRDGSCTDTHDGKLDLQDALTHELGHTLGLADLPDRPDTHWLTMQHGIEVNERFRNTLARGDVLGVRHLYPTDAPMPPIYDP